MWTDGGIVSLFNTYIVCQPLLTLSSIFKILNCEKYFKVPGSKSLLLVILLLLLFKERMSRPAFILWKYMASWSEVAGEINYQLRNIKAVYMILLHGFVPR
jgi:hypothetical protein